MERETFRIDEWTQARLEADVERGKFANKSDGIRYILRSHYDDDAEPEGELRGRGGDPDVMPEADPS